MKDVPFFPYAPYLPQTEMSVTGASFSQKRVQLPPVAEEDGQEEVEERVEDNEKVHSSVYNIHIDLLHLHSSLLQDNQCKLSCLPVSHHLIDQTMWHACKCLPDLKPLFQVCMTSSVVLSITHIRSSMRGSSKAKLGSCFC